LKRKSPLQDKVQTLVLVLTPKYPQGEYHTKALAKAICSKIKATDAKYIPSARRIYLGTLD